MINVYYAILCLQLSFPAIPITNELHLLLDRTDVCCDRNGKYPQNPAVLVHDVESDKDCTSKHYIIHKLGTIDRLNVSPTFDI